MGGQLARLNGTSRSPHLFAQWLHRGDDACGGERAADLLRRPQLGPSTPNRLAMTCTLYVDSASVAVRKPIAEPPPASAMRGFPAPYSITMAMHHHVTLRA